MKKSILQSFFDKDKIEAGCDEAGRGCLAGPVFAAAVILPKDYYNDLLRDSKKLNEIQRDALFNTIKQEALAYSIQKISSEEIDEINILNASFKAMSEAAKTLKIKPELLLIDGNRFKSDIDIPHKCIVKGDDKFFSIAAASILAKVSRDRYMKKQAIKYPQYGWESNKGYPTVKHRIAIKEHGTTPIHRMSFNLLGKTSQLDLFE